MWEDPIVAEIHRTRKQLAAQFNFDVRAIFADLRKRQASLGTRLVSPKKRVEPTDEIDQGSHFVSPKSTPSKKAPAA
jgi:hypothetical protein